MLHAGVNWFGRWTGNLVVSLLVRPPEGANKLTTEGCGLSAPEIVGHRVRLV